jgi:hypothetical protein
MTNVITIPPFPKMGGHGGEPAPPKQGERGIKPIRQGLDEIQKDLQEKGLVSKTVDFADLQWLQDCPKITIKKKNGSYVVTVQGPNVVVETTGPESKPKSSKK